MASLTQAALCDRLPMLTLPTLVLDDGATAAALAQYPDSRHRYPYDRSDAAPSRLMSSTPPGPPANPRGWRSKHHKHKRDLLSGWFVVISRFIGNSRTHCFRHRSISISPFSILLVPSRNRWGFGSRLAFGVSLSHRVHGVSLINTRTVGNTTHLCSRNGCRAEKACRSSNLARRASQTRFGRKTLRLAKLRDAQGGRQSLRAERNSQHQLDVGLRAERGGDFPAAISVVPLPTHKSTFWIASASRCRRAWGDSTSAAPALARGYLTGPSSRQSASSPIRSRRRGCTRPATWCAGCPTARSSSSAATTSRSRSRLPHRARRDRGALARHSRRRERPCSRARTARRQAPGGLRRAGRCAPAGAARAAASRRRCPSSWYPAIVASDAAADPQRQARSPALPAPDARRVSSADLRAAARCDRDRSLATLWQRPARRRPVGRHDNFFELGGHSLLVAH